MTHPWQMHVCQIPANKSIFPKKIDSNFDSSMTHSCLIHVYEWLIHTYQIWSIHKWDTTHPCARNYSFVRETALIYVCDTTYSYVRHGEILWMRFSVTDLFICAELLIPWDSTHLRVRFDPFVCETWSVRGIKDVHLTYSYARNDGFIRETGLIYVCDLTDSHVRHEVFVSIRFSSDSLKCTGFWLIHDSFVYTGFSCDSFMAHSCILGCHDWIGGYGMNLFSTLPFWVCHKFLNVKDASKYTYIYTHIYIYVYIYTHIWNAKDASKIAKMQRCTSKSAIFLSTSKSAIFQRCISKSAIFLKDGTFWGASLQRCTSKSAIFLFYESKKWPTEKAGSKITIYRVFNTHTIATRPKKLAPTIFMQIPRAYEQG